MKKTIIAVSLVFALALSGCASLSGSAQVAPKTASQTPMTQEIAGDDDTAASTPGASQTAAAPADTASTASTAGQDTFSQYIDIKAQRDALDIDLSIMICATFIMGLTPRRRLLQLQMLP